MKGDTLNAASEAVILTAREIEYLSLAAMAILPLSLTMGMGAFKMANAEEETTTSVPFS